MKKHLPGLITGVLIGITFTAFILKHYERKKYAAPKVDNDPSGNHAPPHSVNVGVQ